MHEQHLGMRVLLQSYQNTKGDFEEEFIVLVDDQVPEPIRNDITKAGAQVIQVCRGCIYVEKN